MTLEGAAPAGWYPDPDSEHAHTMRYWDGREWTQHRHRDAESDSASREPGNSAQQAGSSKQSVSETLSTARQGFGDLWSRFSAWCTAPSRGWNPVVAASVMVGTVLVLVSGLM